MKPTLVVMVKEPRPGRVKTRLGREIGMVTAAWWFRHQVARLIRRLTDRRWHLVLAVTPDRAGLGSRVWPANVLRAPQGRGSLGDRMARMLSRQGPVCVIGADIPDISKRDIAAAFRLLGDHDAVFGPAPDGGFWLIGLKSGPKAGLFEGVRWSTSHALQDTLATLGGAKIGYVVSLRDVDTADDLAMTRAGRHDTSQT